MYVHFRIILGSKLSINILSVVLSSHLLYDDFNLFLSKPTYSSDNERNLKPENFPGIFLCSMPAYNYSELKRHGYLTMFNYTMGLMKNNKIAAWSGNGSVEIEKVANDIAMIKTVKDCPNLRVKYTFKKIKLDRVKFELAYSGNPPGQCCRAIIPENAKDHSAITFIFDVTLSKNPDIEGFQIFLSNQESFHKFNMLQFNTNGILLKAYKNKPGYKVFRTRIHDHIRLEEDPNISCKDYKNKIEYSKGSLLNKSKIFNIIASFSVWMMISQNKL